MKYKVALLDADGVTLKDEGLFSERLCELGFITSLEKTRPFFEGVFQDCLVGRSDLKNELAKVIGEWGWKGTVDELVEFWFTIGDDRNPDIVNFINELRKNGVACYMTTDQEKYRGQYLREKFSKTFDDFFISNEIGHKKKESAYFEYVYKRVRNKAREKSEILFVDDNERNVTNARAFGIDAILYHNPDDLLKIAL